MLGVKFILLALALGVSALAFSMQGLGGGVLYTPIQVLFGLDFHEAASRSQLFIIVTSLSSTLIFRKAGKIDWPVALALETPAAAGGYLGGFYAHRFPAEGLLLVLALMVMLAALSMLRELPPSQDSPPNESHWWVWRRRQGGRVYDVNLAQGLPVFLLIGVFSGLVGVAGGFVKIPVMALLFRIPMDVVLGCSAFMVSLTAAGGLVGASFRRLVGLGADAGSGRLRCRGSTDRPSSGTASRSQGAAATLRVFLAVGGRGGFGAGAVSLTSPRRKHPAAPFKANTRRPDVSAALAAKRRPDVSPGWRQSRNPGSRSPYVLEALKAALEVRRRQPLQVGGHSATFHFVVTLEPNSSAHRSRPITGKINFTSRTVTLCRDNLRSAELEEIRGLPYSAIRARKRAALRLGSLGSRAFANQGPAPSPGAGGLRRGLTHDRHLWALGGRAIRISRAAALDVSLGWSRLRRNPSW